MISFTSKNRHYLQYVQLLRAKDIGKPAATAQHGARHVILASRSGTLAKHTDAEWDAVQASEATLSLERCDTCDSSHVHRVMTVAPFVRHVWHAAGVLADRLLSEQSASGLGRVYAPKAHGAWSLHAASATRAFNAFALFSSVTALLGGAGQANYGAANVCLDALGAYRRVRGAAAEPAH